MNTEKLDQLNESEYGCPQFEAFLKSRFSDRDIASLQAWAGQVVMGENFSQKILLLVGGPQLGKTSLVNIFSWVFGDAKCELLSIPHLATTFGMARFRGKSLLVASDLRSNVFRLKSARHLKSLIGGDKITVERQGRSREWIRGCFNIIFSMNDEPRFPKGEEVAWTRRLVVLRMSGTPVKPLRPDFCQSLLQDEAAGIWRWMLGGMGEARSGFSQGGIPRVPVDSEEVKARLSPAGLVREKRDALRSELAEIRVMKAELKLRRVQILNELGTLGR